MSKCTRGENIIDLLHTRSSYYVCNSAGIDCWECLSFAEKCIKCLTAYFSCIISNTYKI